MTLSCFFLMVAVLSVLAVACFMVRALFAVLFIMAAAFFRMFGHECNPPLEIFDYTLSMAVQRPSVAW
jgi:hypothetical protein